MDGRNGEDGGGPGAHTGVTGDSGGEPNVPRPLLLTRRLINASKCQTCWNTAMRD